MTTTDSSDPLMTPSAKIHRGNTRRRARRLAVDSALVPGDPFADFRTIVRDTCSRFTTTTGWNLTFIPAEAEDAAALEYRLRQDSSCFWYECIRAGSATIGVLTISRRRTQVPAERLRKMVLSLSDACDVAEIAARLLNQIVTRCRALDLAGADSDFDAQHFSDALRSLSGFDAVAVFVRGSHGLRPEVASGIDIVDLPQIDEGETSEPSGDGVLFGRRTVVLQEPSRWLPQSFRSALGVALDRRNAGLGTVWFYSRADRGITSIEADRAASLAGRFSVIFDGAAAERLRHDNTVHRRELELLAFIQQAGRCDPVTRDPSLDTACFLHNHTAVGGDLFEIISLDEHRTVVAVGDACGHGLPAAVITSTVRGCLRCLVREDRSDPAPAAILQTISHALNSATPTYMFMTMFLGLINTRTNTIRYASAGHPPPMLIGETLRQLDGRGLLLGVTNDAEYAVRAGPFHPNETLVLFTDGVTEAKAGRGEPFDLEHAAVSAQQTTREAEPFLAQVLKDLKRHVGDLTDDATLAVVRRA